MSCPLEEEFTTDTLEGDLGGAPILSVEAAILYPGVAELAATSL